MENIGSALNRGLMCSCRYFERTGDDDPSLAYAHFLTYEKA